MDTQGLLRGIVYSLVFASIGIVVLALAFGLMRWLAPFSMRKELEEDQNTAVAIVIGSVILGISIIIAASIHG